MITKEQGESILGTGERIKSNVDFSGVPNGTEGVIDEKYEWERGGGGFMVAWDLPDSPLPVGYKTHTGKPAIATGLLRDGFGWDELKYLDLVDLPLDIG